MKKKVLIVQQPAGGGSMVALYEMVRNLKEHGFEFHIVFYHQNEFSERFREMSGCVIYYPFSHENIGHEKPGFTSSNVIVNAMILEWRFFLNYYFRSRHERKALQNIIESISPQLIHHNNGMLENLSSVRVATKLRIPQVLHTRGIMSRRKCILGYIMNFRLLRKVDYRIYVSEEAKYQVEKKYSLDCDKGVALYDFVGSQFLENNSFEKADEFSHQGDFIISNIGRITEWKGQHIMLEALALIKDKIPLAKVFLIGSHQAGIGCGKYYRRLQNMVHEKGLSHLVFFLGDRKDVKSLMLSSDLIVHSSVKPEPQGLVIIEAMLCNKPVIGTNAGGAGTLLKKYGGITFAPGDAVSLSSLILHQYRIGKNKNQNVLLYPALKRDFDPDCQRRRLLKVYNNVLQDKL